MNKCPYHEDLQKKISEIHAAVLGDNLGNAGLLTRQRVFEIKMEGVEKKVSEHKNFHEKQKIAIICLGIGSGFGGAKIVELVSKHLF